MKHKSEDYKISAVQYYIKNKVSMDKTDNSYFYRSFTLLVAICNSKYIGYVLYEKGGMTKERFVDFLKSFIFNKYKNYLIILDNAGSHNNQYVNDAIINI